MNMVAVLLVLVTVLRLLELLTVLLWRDTSMAQPPHTSATHQHMLIMHHLGVEISSWNWWWWWFNEFHRSHTCDALEKGHYFSNQPHVFHYILDYVQHLLLWHHPQFTTFCRIGSVSLQTWNVQENEFTTEVCWNLFKWRGCCTAPAPGQALYTRCTHLYFVHTACTHLLSSSTNIEWHIPYLLNVVMLTLQF